MADQENFRTDSREVLDFLDKVALPQRQAEARRLVQVFSDVTGFPARMWASGIVGFGRYAYRYASGHAGESFATGFAPRTPDLTFYIMPGYQDYSAILSRLGRHRLGKSCLYVRHLNGIDEAALRELIARGLADLGHLWPVHAT